MKAYKRIAAAVMLWVFLLPAAVFANDEAPSLTYHLIEQRYYKLGDTGYIVEDRNSYIGTPEKIDSIGVYAEVYNKHFSLGENVKKYLYLVESTRCVKIKEDMSGENPVYTRLKESYDLTASDTLALESYEQFMDWFYQTDHHWNYKGSYQGYCDLIDMMFGPEEEKIQPIETVTFSDIKFNGSFNKRLKKTDSTESFTVYRFPEFAPYTALINGEPSKTYGNADQYFKGKYSKTKLANHYGLFYGGDHGEMILKTNRPEKKTLMIVSNSLANAVKLLLLQHYDAIYVVDPRHYAKQMGKRLNAKEYIEKNEIDEVLFMGDAAIFLYDPAPCLTAE